jgi:hypothetical protein
MSVKDGKEAVIRQRAQIRDRRVRVLKTEEGRGSGGLPDGANVVRWAERGGVPVISA